MTLEEMRQSKANLEYIVTAGQPELIVPDDIRNLINYIENESIPKEKIREKIKWYDEFLEKNKEQLLKLNLCMIYSDKKEALQELLGE